MREYKFRAWDTLQKRYDYDVLMYHGKACYIDAFDALEFYDVGRFVIEQYTGLKDRNGNDIYEGDILLDQRFDSGTGEVYFDPELAVWKVRFQQEDWLYEFHDCSEVIGNRFDNPELLGEVRE